MFYWQNFLVLHILPLVFPQVPDMNVCPTKICCPSIMANSKALMACYFDPRGWMAHWHFFPKMNIVCVCAQKIFLSRQNLHAAEKCWMVEETHPRPSLLVSLIPPDWHFCFMPVKYGGAVIFEWTSLSLHKKESRSLMHCLIRCYSVRKMGRGWAWRNVFMKSDL